MGAMRTLISKGEPYADAPKWMGDRIGTRYVSARLRVSFVDDRLARAEGYRLEDSNLMAELRR